MIIQKAKFTEFAHLCENFLKKLSQTIDKRKVKYYNIKVKESQRGLKMTKNKKRGDKQCPLYLILSKNFC